jgi:hypothetical protein
VGYNREDFTAVWDTMEEKLLHYEIQWRKILVKQSEIVPFYIPQ